MFCDINDLKQKKTPLYYNILLFHSSKDYGVASQGFLLDMVKVLAFALSEGKVAVHCHAGLGRKTRHKCTSRQFIFTDTFFLNLRQNWSFNRLLLNVFLEGSG